MHPKYIEILNNVGYSEKDCRIFEDSNHCLIPIIKSPGKFEGETIATLYFFSVMMNGDFGDIDSGEAFEVYSLTPDDLKVFPWLEGSKYFLLEFDDNGFVYGRDTLTYTVKESTDEDNENN